MRAGRRAELAAQLGLASASEKRVGRPSRTDLWQQELYKALKTDSLPVEVLDVGSTPPEWWEKGMPLVMDRERVIDDMAQDGGRDRRCGGPRSGKRCEG